MMQAERKLVGIKDDVMQQLVTKHESRSAVSTEHDSVQSYRLFL